jgi:hypothetical protein
MDKQELFQSDGVLRRDGDFSVSFSQVKDDKGDTTGIRCFVTHEPSGKFTSFHMEVKDLNHNIGPAYEDTKKGLLAEVDAAE